MQAACVPNLTYSINGAANSVGAFYRRISILPLTSYK
jgi:hypothetical protein